MLRVTEAIKLCGLMDLEFVDEFAMKRGEYVHKAIKAFCRGTLIEETVDPEHVAPRLESFRAWLRQSGAKMLETELHVVNEAMGYQGTLDGLVEVGGFQYICDWKNGAAQSWHPYQLALYAMAFLAERPTAKPPLLRANVYLDPDGKPAKFVERKDRRDFDRAKAIVTVAYIVKENEA